MNFRCDYNETCRWKPSMECFYEDEEKERHWCYLCFWHYIWVRFIKREKGNGYADVDTTREAIEQLREELWDIQGDLMLIKEKLKIKEPKVYEPGKEEEKGYE